jgi:hypothetical protein
MVMPIRHDLIIENFETPFVQRTDYSKPVFADNMHISKSFEDSNDPVNPEWSGYLGRFQANESQSCDVMHGPSLSYKF